MDQLLVSRRDAAIALGISLRSLDYLLARGELPSRQIGRRKMIARTALERFAASTTAKEAVNSNGQ
jgi:hypothetical protein